MVEIDIERVKINLKKLHFCLIGTCSAMVYALITQAFSFHLGSDWIIEFELQNRIVIGIPALMELKIRTGL